MVGATIKICTLLSTLSTNFPGTVNLLIELVAQHNAKTQKSGACFFQLVAHTGRAGESLSLYALQSSNWLNPTKSGWLTNQVDTTAFKDDDFSTALSTLHNQIQKREASLSYIRTRERRAVAVVTGYSLAVWVVALAVWYAGVAEGWWGWTAVLAAPVGILAVRRIVAWWYRAKREHEEKVLVELRKKQRSKVEELKKKTGYYSTRDLLEKYDDSPSKEKQREKEAQEEKAKRPQPRPSLPPTSPQHPNLGIPPHILAQRGLAPPPRLSDAALPPNPNALPPNFQPPPPLPPPPRTWADKLADVLLGADDPSSSSSSNEAKYALICAKCYAHNRLSTREEVDSVVYRCPKCGFLNGRPSSQNQLELERLNESVESEGASGHDVEGEKEERNSPRPNRDGEEGGMDNSN
ncbi:hypothetical protein BT69DRAFT_1323407 [Atractiella rhizophila]|nr:hypothetical protein BT69DRAFT_1323407 [Atractiella rhizophila]